MNKLIFLGLDGATWNQFDKFLSSKSMPNLSKLLSEGTKGQLLSTFPFTSRTSWISMLTGVNPGKHGIPHHIVGGQQELPSIWELLAKEKKVIVVNDIVTFPPIEINGIMITGGFSTPPNSRNFVYPKSILTELDSITGGYIPSLDSSFMKLIKNNQHEEAFLQLQEYGEKFVKTSFYLSKKYPWEVLSTTLENSDYIHHFFWDKPLYLGKFYKWLDKIIGDYHQLAKANNANLVIASDHGFGPIKKHFLINSWLRKSNLSNFKSVGKIRKFIGKSNVNRSLVRKGLDKLHLRALASKYTPSEMKKIIPLEKNEVGYIDENSLVFSEAYNEITIKPVNEINRKEITEKVIRELLELEDDGKKIVKEIHKREEIFHGPYVDRAYDLQMLLTEGYCWSPAIREKFILSPEEFNKTRMADHRPEGIFIFAGPDINSNDTLYSAKIWDIFPTLLHISGLLIPSYVDGKIIKDVFKPNSILFKKQPRITKSEKESIKDKILQKRNKLTI
jgi:predicted AlkP superfamily phosphohydrolase/phosphomutase